MAYHETIDTLRYCDYCGDTIGWGHHFPHALTHGHGCVDCVQERFTPEELAYMYDEGDQYYTEWV